MEERSGRRKISYMADKGVFQCNPLTVVMQETRDILLNTFCSVNNSPMHTDFILSTMHT